MIRKLRKFFLLSYYQGSGSYFRSSVSYFKHFEIPDEIKIKFAKLNYEDEQNQHLINAKADP